MVLQMKQKEPPLPIENLPFPFGPLLDECWAVDVDKRPSMTGTLWIKYAQTICSFTRLKQLLSIEKDVVKIMKQIELCTPEPTKIDLEKTEVNSYAPSVSTIVKSEQTVKEGIQIEHNCI